MHTNALAARMSVYHYVPSARGGQNDPLELSYK